LSQVEPLDLTTAGKLKRFKRVEVNALHFEACFGLAGCRSGFMPRFRQTIAA